MVREQSFFGCGLVTRVVIITDLPDWTYCPAIPPKVVWFRNSQAYSYAATVLEVILSILNVHCSHQH
jgi:hypothetical protein